MKTQKVDLKKLSNDDLFMHVDGGMGELWFLLGGCIASEDEGFAVDSYHELERYIEEIKRRLVTNEPKTF